ncbi:transcriptional regulator, GntR family [Psychrobacillus psychrotolerans]|uniref:Transcriptional regulator, GntR family n=1 Tax=Psychrobacillus psychrotolerans TaxID=126156 RepID=A0A1I5YJY4_9BACI|nr:GntR family transcriptional regulator [Psychrobacillus psychrotolerans]SFQ44533.1 transcriptional regulator, GntR family [Psychrobacillus psychrotolerans]
MTQHFTRDKPIYSQLVDIICGDILKGNLQPGDKMLSVREYSLEVGVNVNTVQRVYKELEMMGLTDTKRGQGTFITTEEGRIQHLREDMKVELVTQFIQSIAAFGFSKEEIIQILQRKEESK